MVTMVGCDDAWLCQDEEDTDMLSVSVPTVFPSPPLQRALSPPVFPSSPTGFYRQRNSTNHSNPPQEMSPGSVQISCAANPPPAEQGAGNDERGDSSGSMCENVAGALSTNTAVLCSPPRQLPTDPGTGSFGDSRGWALDYYQHMSPCFLFVSQSPPRAQSQTLSDSVDYIGVGGLCNFDDDGHTGTLGISTCTASTNLDVAAGRQQLTGSGENVSDLRLEDKCLNPFDEGLRREVALDIGELKGSFLASAKRGGRISSVIWFHFLKAISPDNMRIARCKHCYVVLKADSKINGSSHLHRHLKSFHLLHLGARSDALKRLQSLSFPEPERGKKKECVENPMQGSISPKCIESKHVDIGPGHVSENQIQGTTKSKSEVGLHFTKEVHGQGSGICKAKCQQCKSVQGDILERHQSLCFLELEKGTKKQCTENSMLQGSDRNQYIDSSKHLEVAPGAVSGKQVEGTSSGNRNRVKRGPKRAAVGGRRQVVEGTRRLRSHVWKLFKIEFLVNDNGSQTKMGRCIYCDTLLKADSTKNGTSRLWKHIKEFHKITKHVNEENKTNEEIEPGDVSRKSEAWDHFTMGVDVEGSSIVNAMCRHCDNLFKVDSTTNDTCILRHITEFHRIKLRKHFNEEKSRNDGAPSDPGQRRVRHISSETKSLLKRSAKQIVVMHNKRKRATCEGIEKQDYICTKSELKLLKTVMKKPLDGEELLVDISRTECLTRKELDCLFQKRGKEAYLNNEVMNAYIALLNSNKKLLHRNDESIVLETTFLHALLKRDAFLNDQMNSFSSMEENNGKRRIRNMVVSYLNNDMIFLPINVAEKHWYLGVINAKKKCIQILDSCGTAFGRTDLEATIKGLQKYIVMVSGWEQLESDKWPD